MANQDNKTMTKLFGWGIVLVVLIGLVGMGYFIKSQNNQPLPGEVFDITGRNHIPDDTKASNYNSNPPTSGDHYNQPADWGIYPEALPDERVVHNLEHGGVWVSYNCSLLKETSWIKGAYAQEHSVPADTFTEATSSGAAINDSDSCKKLIADLEGVVEGYRSKVIMTPRAANDKAVAVVSWGRLWKMEQFDGDRLREFIDKNRNRGPEFVPD